MTEDLNGCFNSVLTTDDISSLPGVDGISPKLLLMEAVEQISISLARMSSKEGVVPFECKETNHLLQEIDTLFLMVCLPQRFGIEITVPAMLAFSSVIL